MYSIEDLVELSKPIVQKFPHIIVGFKVYDPFKHFIQAGRLHRHCGFTVITDYPKQQIIANINVDGQKVTIAEVFGRNDESYQRAFTKVVLQAAVSLELRKPALLVKE